MGITKVDSLSLTVVIISFFTVLYFYTGILRNLSSYWNFRDEIDEYVARSWRLFLPILMAVLLFSLSLIPC